MVLAKISSFNKTPANGQRAHQSLGGIRLAGSCLLPYVTCMAAAPGGTKWVNTGPQQIGVFFIPVWLNANIFPSFLLKEQ